MYKILVEMRRMQEQAKVNKEVDYIKGGDCGILILRDATSVLPPCSMSYTYIYK